NCKSIYAKLKRQSSALCFFTLERYRRSKLCIVEKFISQHSSPSWPWQSVCRHLVKCSRDPFPALRPTHKGPFCRVPRRKQPTIPRERYSPPLLIIQDCFASA